MNRPDSVNEALKLVNEMMSDEVFDTLFDYIQRLERMAAYLAGLN